MTASFVDPERLWALLIVPLLIAAYVWVVTRKRKQGMRFTNTTLLSRVVPKQSQWRRHIAVALSLLSLITLTAAWARPNGIDYVPRERATIVLVIDVSQSMAATDVAPSRLEAEKQAAVTFVKSLPATFNVAVVSLSGSPALRLPPTTDRVQAQQTINGLKLQDSTAIGESLWVALEAMKLVPKGEGDDSPTPGAIVLLSDGTNTAGRSPMQAAAAAAEQEVPVYTIAYGTDALAYVDLPADDTHPATRAAVPPDPDLMRGLAEVAKGRAFSASSLGELDEVYRDIRSEVGKMPVEKEVTALWAGYGLAFAVVAAIAAVSLGARWP